ncbi:MAG: TIGR01777 family protein [Acidimicrobiales bacterium]|nr:TIGR01777 family protein [Acidimicrobiales bacterium]
MDVAITGSSGLIGKALKAALQASGDRPISLVRRPTRGEDEIQYDPAAGTLDGASLEGIDAVVNLAGVGIGDKRWTESYRKLILNSRVDTTSLVARTVAGLESRPSAFLSGSAIGIYGDRPDTVNTEVSPAADTFLADVVTRWELATTPAVDAGIRTVFLRTGIVLAPRGGALQKMLPLFKLGLGGKFGSGRQYWSWITLEDEVRAIQYLLKDESIGGPVNLTAPNPVTNAQFAKTLGRVLARPAILPVPKFGPGLLLGRELAQALLFDSANVEPMVLNKSDFSYHHPELEVALRDILDKP